ncbi:DUF2878 domain-containing protein [Alteromonas sp. D210916BOD_24]|uniref:DUF2878 domain-containing protein n=1 Tax=Alteromonas sp. D210916BOD_24 TaxID=3157618 RepID=UPI00399CBE64
MKNNAFLPVLNGIGFQVIWWLVILFQNNAIAPVMGLILLWLWFSPTRTLDIKLMIAVTILGTLIDGALTLSGIFVFEQRHQLVAFWPIPVWLSLLWSALAVTLVHSLSLFRNRRALAALVGGHLAPLSYLAGAKLGAVTLGTETLFTYFILAGIWAVAFPLCFYLSKRLDSSELKTSTQAV